MAVSPLPSLRTRNVIVSELTVIQRPFGETLTEPPALVGRSTTFRGLRPGVTRKSAERGPLCAKAISLPFGSQASGPAFIVRSDQRRWFAVSEMVKYPGFVMYAS